MTDKTDKTAKTDAEATKPIRRVIYVDRTLDEAVNLYAERAKLTYTAAACELLARQLVYQGLIGVDEKPQRIDRRGGKREGSGRKPKKPQT